MICSRLVGVSYYYSLDEVECRYYRAQAEWMNGCMELDVPRDWTRTEAVPGGELEDLRRE